MIVATPRRTPPGLGIGLLLVASAVMATLVLRIPLGASEAPALSWLARFVAAAGISLDAIDRVFLAAYHAGQPALSFTLAVAVSKCVPALDTLIAMRLPDALAALGLTGLVYRIAGPGEAGFAAALWVLIAAVACIGWIAPPGLMLDQWAAVVILVAHDARARTPGLAWLGLALGVAALVANSAGVYAIAVLAGAWLYGGLAERDWRFLGSHRLTALGALIVAGLTLTPTLGLPRATPFMALYHQFAGPIRYDGLPVLVFWCLAAWIVPALIALGATLIGFGGPARRHALIVLLGCLILSATATASPAALACLAPFLALWLIAPIQPCDDTGQGPPRWLLMLYGIVFLGQALVFTGWSVTANEGVAETPLIWAIAAAVVLVAVAAAVASGRRGLMAAGYAPVALSVLALAIALMGVFDQPRRITPQRLFDHSLAKAMQPFSTSPIAVLAPVDAALWRAELGRPVFHAADLSALCRWAAQSAGKRLPVVLAPASATSEVQDRFPNARLELQSPGTPSSSVMAIRVGRPAKQTCQGGSKS